MNRPLTTEAMDAAPAGSLIIHEPTHGHIEPIASKMLPDGEGPAWVDADGDRYPSGDAFMETWGAITHALWLYTAPLFTKEG